MALSDERREARRRRLVDVAQGLIREKGDAGFAMTELAARAGVSPATPYNLVGSKAEVLRLVVRAEFDSFSVRLGEVRQDSALAFLLEAAAMVVVHYEADRRFYRGLYRAALSLEGGEVGDLMTAEGQLLWRGLVQAAVDQGELEPFVQVAPFTDVLLRVMSATVQAWLAGGWSEARFALEMAHAVRLLLASVAAAPSRAALVEQIVALQAALTAPPHAEPVTEGEASSAA